MTDDDREWLREGVRRSKLTRPTMLSSKLTWEHRGYYYLIGWLTHETEQSPNAAYHDGGGIF